MPIQKIKSGRVVRVTVDTYVGEKGAIFYDEELGELRLSDGVTPGGILLGSGGGSGYILPTASTTIKGGVKVDGTTIKINNQIISGFSGSYVDLTGKPSIPSDVSQLTDLSNLLVSSNDLNLTGGSISQILVKKSNTDLDYQWEDMIINLPQTTYTKLLDDSVVNTIYLGEAVPGSIESNASWRVQKIVLDSNGNVDSVRFAGVGQFDQIWNNRLILTYV